MSSHPPRPSLVETLEKWLLPVGVIAALSIGIVGIGRFIRLDEANSVIIASSNVGRILEYLRNDNNLPFYYLMLHGWIRLGGINEWVVHLPSVAFYLLAVGATYWLGWEVSQDWRSALYSGFFFLVSLQAIQQAQKTRMYSLLGLVAALSTLFFFRAWWGKTASKRDWALYALVNAVGTFVHVWYFFLLLAHALCGLLFQRKRLRSLAAAQCLSLSPFVVLWARYLSQQAKIGATDWMPHVRPSFFLSVLGEFYGGERWGLVFLFVVAGICVLGARNRDQREQLPYRAVAALATIALVCLIVPLLVSFVRPIYWPGRYTMIALPALAAALGCCVAALASPALRVPFAYGMLIIVIALHVRSRHKVFENSVNVFAEGESDKTATRQLCRSAGPRDTLVFTGLTRAGVEYYLRRFGCGQDLVLLSLPADTADHLGWVRRTATEDLRAEAEGIAQRFMQETQGGGKLWLILAYGRQDQKVFTEVFDRDLGASTRLPLRGSFFDEVLIYTPKEEGQHGVP
jgi:hypothetical protein